MHTVAIIAVACVLATVALAQIPVPCTTPFQWQGGILVQDPSANAFEIAEFFYDALNQRMATFAKVYEQGHKHEYQFIEAYGTNTGYQINLKKQTCQVYQLNAPFQPIAIPANATFIGAFTVGVVLDVYGWAGQFADPQGGLDHYQAFVAGGDGGASGTCVPVYEFFESNEAGQVAQSFVNVEIGISNPNVFVPPSYCATATTLERASKFNPAAKRIYA